MKLMIPMKTTPVLNFSNILSGNKLCFNVIGDCTIKLSNNSSGRSLPQKMNEMNNGNVYISFSSITQVKFPDP